MMTMPRSEFDLAQARILLIEDNPINREVISNVLEQAGAVLSHSGDGVDGLAKSYLERPELILLDIMLPDMEGFEVCGSLKSHPAVRDIPVIFLTSLDDDDSRLKAFEVGGVDYVIKPLQPDELLARVQVHLRLRRAEQRLEQHIRHFEGLLNTAPICIGLLSPNGSYQEINEHCLRMFATTRADMIGHSYLDFTHSQERASSRDELRRLRTGESKSEYSDRRMVRANGQTFWGDRRLSALYDAEGHCESIVCVINDLSDRKQAETALQVTSEQLQAILNSAPQGFFLLDTEYRVQAFNRTAMRLNRRVFGVEPRAGESFYNFIKEEDREFFDTCLTQALEGGGQDHEKAFRVVSGDILWLSFIAHPVFDADGLINGICLSVQDVTRRRQGEARTRRDEQFLRRVYENLPMPVFMLSQDARGDVRYTAINPALEHLGGLTQQQVVNRRLDEVPGLLPLSSEDLKNYHTACLEAGKMLEWDVSLVESEERWLLRLNPITGLSGTQMIGVLSPLNPPSSQTTREGKSPRPEAESSGETPAHFDPEQLRQLIRLVKRGDIVGLRAYLEQLRGELSPCPPEMARFEELASRLKLTQIHQLAMELNRRKP